MGKKVSKMQSLFMLAIAVLAWAGVVMQFYIGTNTWQKLGLSTGEGTIRFFSYFTILSNIIVAICMTVTLFMRASSSGIFFAKATTQTAIAVYIFVVGLVYHLLLAKLWSPEGLAFLVDQMLHSIVPLLYVIYWLVFLPRVKMKAVDLLGWLIYPAVYFLWVLILGAFTNFYPYPFIDANVLGYPKTFLHALVLMIVFSLLCLVAMAIKRSVGKKDEPIIGQ